MFMKLTRYILLNVRHLHEILLPASVWMRITKVLASSHIVYVNEVYTCNAWALNQSSHNAFLIIMHNNYSGITAATIVRIYGKE